MHLNYLVISQLLLLFIVVIVGCEPVLEYRMNLEFDEFVVHLLIELI